MSVKRYAAHTNIDDFKSDWHESKEGPMVKYEDYAALEARCLELASENAGLKRFPDQIVSFIGKLGSSEIGSETKEKIEAAAKKIKTPATDAFLAEVRARGVEMFAQWCRGERDFTLIDEDISDAAAYEECEKRAEYFAAQLRKGVQS